MFAENHPTPTTKERKNTMPLANVQQEGPWIKVYDEKSKRISQMSANNVELQAVGSDFFVTREGPWIKTYDENCKRIAQMSSSNVEVRSAAGRNFITKEGPWLKTYDRSCKKVSQKSA